MAKNEPKEEMSEGKISRG